MAVEREGLVRRRGVSGTINTLTGSGHSLDERLGAGVRVVACTGPIAVLGEQIAVHGGSVLAAAGAAAEPGLVTLAVAVPAGAVVSGIIRGFERDHDRDAKRWPALEYIYHDADKAAAIRAQTPLVFRRVAAGSFVAAGTAAMAAGALVLGPAIGLGHTGVAAQDLGDAAEILAAGGAAAAVVARNWSRRLASMSPRSLGE